MNGLCFFRPPPCFYAALAYNWCLAYPIYDDVSDSEAVTAFPVVAAYPSGERKIMAYLKPQRPEKVTAPSLRASKERKERLVCLTAYDYTMARIVDEAGIDIILVGDSIGNTVMGYGNTVPVTLDEIVMHARAVRRGVQRALLVADMPYGSFPTGENDAVGNALRLIKEGGAEAVKLEGGHKRVQLVKRLVDEEISVMGHIGLTP